MLKSWFGFFRIVNLPTVPGDVLVGAAATMTAWGAAFSGTMAATVTAAALASCGAYLFGLADNDLVGAKTDADRPIPNGEISLPAARLARLLCAASALALGAAAHLPALWWATMLALFLVVIAYNRTKDALLMGAARGLNVLGGVGALADSLGAAPAFPPVVSVLADPETLLYAGTAALLETVYIACVTRYARDEATHPEKKPTVGFLIGALVYLQLVLLLVFFLFGSATRGLLLAGAFLLIALRVMKRLLPHVSAT